LVNFVAVDLIRTTEATLACARPKSFDDVRGRAKPLAAMSSEVRAEHLELKQFLNEHVYHHHKVQRMTSKARRVITQLFDAFLADERLLPPEHRGAASGDKKSSAETARARAVADYIAGMTDRYAILEHRRLFDPGERT
jgi:dGTPase